MIEEKQYPNSRSTAMLDWFSCPEVERDPSRVSGSWVFRGTRVPLAALFQNLGDGASLSDFLEWFPGVTAHQAQVVLDHITALSRVCYNNGCVLTLF